MAGDSMAGTKRDTTAPLDLDALFRFVYQLCLLPQDQGNQTSIVINGVKQMLGAESACIYESRSRTSLLVTKLYEQDWEDWQTEELARCLAVRRPSEWTRRHFQVDWCPPRLIDTPSNRWHCIVSCLRAKGNHFVTLAFARPREEFLESARSVLRSFHQSPAFEFILPRRPVEPEPTVTARMRDVHARLLKGHSEKQIAKGLYLSHHTIHAYVKMLYRRYSVNTRAELMSLSINLEAHSAIPGGNTPTKASGG